MGGGGGRVVGGGTHARVSPTMRWRLLRAVGGRHQEHGLKNVLPTQKGGLCQSETRGVEEVRLPPLSPHSPHPLSLSLPPYHLAAVGLDVHVHHVRPLAALGLPGLVKLGRGERELEVVGRVLVEMPPVPVNRPEEGERASRWVGEWVGEQAGGWVSGWVGG